jgi:hypothetical protein
MSISNGKIMEMWQQYNFAPWPWAQDIIISAQPNSNRLPILSIHGYGEDSSIWNSWRNWLEANSFLRVCPITFSDDKYGSVEEHATELLSLT